MKCKSCGNNLQIDNSFCPFCGTENPVAKKHREDMKKFAMDYSSTKNTVIKNSKHFNAKILKIASVIITLAAIVVLISIAVNINHLGYSASRRITAKEADQYIPEVQELIKAEDYCALNELVYCHNLYREEIYDGRYFFVFRITDSYSELYTSILQALKSNETYTDLADTISRNIREISHISQNLNIIPDDCREYAAHLEEDTILLLKTYLNITEEQYNEMHDMSDSLRSVTIEEALNELN